MNGIAGRQVYEILDNAIDEVQGGHARNVKVHAANPPPCLNTHWAPDPLHLQRVLASVSAAIIPAWCACACPDSPGYAACRMNAWGTPIQAPGLMDMRVMRLLEHQAGHQVLEIAHVHCCVPPDQVELDLEAAGG